MIQIHRLNQLYENHKHEHVFEYGDHLLDVQDQNQVQLGYV
jgi:hypothetical protein